MGKNANGIRLRFAPYTEAVEYETLGKLLKPTRKRALKKTELLEDGRYPVVNSGKDLYGHYDEYNNGPDTLVVSSHGAPGFTQYMTEPFWAGALCYPYTVRNGDTLLPKFAYYCLKREEGFIAEKLVKKGGVPYLDRTRLESVRIPVPPIEVQREIVRVLDSFTELEAELEAELEGRKLQYAHYRDRLLSRESLEAMDGKCVETKRLGDVGTFTRGSGIQKKDFVDEGMPCIHYGQVYTYYGLSTDETKSLISPEFYKSRKKASYGDLVIATTSENEEDVCKCVAWLGNTPCAVSGDAYIYAHELDPKYVAYFFSSEQFQNQKTRYITGTKVLRVSGDSMAKIQIPVPSLTTQQKVVDILDRFDALTTSLTDGLPAEIEARRAQYGYYRDKLLNFKRVQDTNKDAT